MKNIKITDLIIMACMIAVTVVILAGICGVDLL